MNEKVVHFPWLHPKLVQGALPDDVVLFDPGVDVGSDRPRWRPAELPCSPAEVRSLLRSYLEFGERFSRPSDMKAYQAMGLENFYSDTGMEIRSQLKGGVAEGSGAADLSRQAQLLLAMALYREEQFVALCEQEDCFEAAREGFADVLGLDDEEEFRELGVPDEALFPRACVELPWRNLLPALLFFLPPGARLFVSDTDVVRELVALDLSFSPCAIGDEGLVCTRLDADALERICGERVELSEPLVIMAHPIEPVTSENGL